jgi:hypothetical protein
MMMMMINLLLALQAVKALYGYKNGAVSMAKYMPAITHGAVTFNPQVWV